MDRTEYIAEMSHCDALAGSRCEMLAEALERCYELEARVQALEAERGALQAQVQALTQERGSLQAQVQELTQALRQERTRHSRAGRQPDRDRYERIGQLLADGLSIRATARACHCSPSTVQRCIAREREAARLREKVLAEAEAARPAFEARQQELARKQAAYERDRDAALAAYRQKHLPAGLG